MWLGLDDTDSLSGGCTTLVFHQLLDSLPCGHGEPRLVRLWPFASRRTRGNAALAVEIENYEGIAEWLDEYWNKYILPLKGNISLSEHDSREQFPSDPGMVLFDTQPDPELYWKAVRGEATFIDGGIQWGGHGRIGATAACAWPGNNSTWEGIAWRKGERLVDEGALKIVDGFEGTFLCRDPRTERGLISPRGPCPVMFGVRATTKSVAKKSTQILLEGSSPTTGSRIFQTNQASWDHVSGCSKHTVLRKEMMKGGHIIINDFLLSFREGGPVNLISQFLTEGDEIAVVGMEYERMLHIEAIKVLHSTAKSRPICDCGTRMKSMGQNQGIRCPECKNISSDEWIEVERIPPFEGWVQPDYDSRRHLAGDLSTNPKW
ncbi:MAG: DUF1743 domain-containing protein [Candidatus Poseidoniaceae archaeon]|jgi:tRNA(Ile2)-agmatinylcytidine synthase|nr:DUF1743 domain-containing protein [Candidatus Poseidoniaceae archaeon]